MTLAAVGIGDPSLPIWEATVQDMIEWLHQTEDPDTGKNHTLTKISRIAGASKGWTDMVRHNGLAARSSKRGRDYENRLRRYVRDLVKQLPREDSSHPPVASEPEMPRTFHAGGIPVPGFPRRPNVGLVRTPVLDEPEPIATPVDEPPLEQPQNPPASDLDFATELQRIKDDMWAFSARFDTLEKLAPALFRPVIGVYRDKLLDLLQDLS